MAPLLAALAAVAGVFGAWDALTVIEQARPAAALGRVVAPLRLAGRAGRAPTTARTPAPRDPRRRDAARRRLAARRPAARGPPRRGGPGGDRPAARGPPPPLAPRARPTASRPSPARWPTRSPAATASAGRWRTSAAPGRSPAPPGSSSRAAAHRLALGAPTETVLADLRARAADPAWDTLIAATLLQRDAGGDLAALLRSIAASREHARRIEADAHTHRAGPRDRPPRRLHAARRARALRADRPGHAPRPPRRPDRPPPAPRRPHPRRGLPSSRSPGSRSWGRHDHHVASARARLACVAGSTIVPTPARRTRRACRCRRAPERGRLMAIMLAATAGVLLAFGVVDLATLVVDHRRSVAASVGDTGRPARVAALLARLGRRIGAPAAPRDLDARLAAAGLAQHDPHRRRDGRSRPARAWRRRCSRRRSSRRSRCAWRSSRCPRAPAAGSSRPTSSSRVARAAGRSARRWSSPTRSTSCASRSPPACRPDAR